MQARELKRIANRAAIVVYNEDGNAAGPDEVIGVTVIIARVPNMCAAIFGSGAAHVRPFASRLTKEAWVERSHESPFSSNSMSPQHCQSEIRSHLFSFCQVPAW